MIRHLVLRHTVILLLRCTVAVLVGLAASTYVPGWALGALAILSAWSAHDARLHVADVDARLSAELARGSVYTIRGETHTAHLSLVRR